MRIVYLVNALGKTSRLVAAIPPCPERQAGIGRFRENPNSLTIAEIYSGGLNRHKT